MYKVFKQIGNGDFVCVALHEDLEEAVQQVESLSVHWPGKYEVRQSETEAVSYSWPAGRDVEQVARV
jgi:hypothetical protein